MPVAPVDMDAFEAAIDANRLRARAKKTERESEVEDAFRKLVSALRGLALKFVSPGRRGVPDRLVLFEIPPEHRELVARYVRFAEIKRPGEVPRPEQLREHERLRALGFTVDVIDSKGAVASAFQGIL